MLTQFKLKPVLGLLIVLSSLAFAGLVSAEYKAPDYSKIENWLCHPDNKSDACDRDLSTTVIAPDGSFSTEKWPENDDPAIDCFYVYPTTSLDETGNSDMVPGEQGELITAYLQTARLRSQCRVFGPMYRQVTIPALRSRMTGGSLRGDGTMTIKDVTAAWNYYLENDNNGRGVVLIGHSQGAGLLARMMAAEIDGKPVQKQLVSAIISGSSIMVPKGKDVGGTLKNIPLCRSADQIGCVITFSSYRDTIPPINTSMFGRGRGELVSGCTNPAALGGGKAELDHHLSTVGEISTSYKEYKPWTNPPKKIPSPFVSLPGLISGECVEKDGFSYLEVSMNPDPNDPRADDVAGDLWAGEEINRGWGLHLIDMSVTMGNLVDVVESQAKAYTSQ